MGQYELETLGETAQFDLFRNSCSQDHCLNYVCSFNIKPTGAMKLRRRCHQFSLPTICLEYNKKHFIARALFEYALVFLVLRLTAMVCTSFILL